MSAAQVVGALLLAGFVLFLTGAVGWRLAYQADLVTSLEALHRDARRWAWIHLWMVAGTFVTTAAVAATVVTGGLHPVAALLAAAVYGLGAALWVVSLVFRLTVSRWAGEMTAREKAPPAGFEALHAWAGGLYLVHMVASYAAFALLGAAVLAGDGLAAWAGWVGVGLGLACEAGLVATRFAGPFNPPILAHTYTALLGVLLLLEG